MADVGPRVNEEIMEPDLELGSLSFEERVDLDIDMDAPPEEHNGRPKKDKSGHKSIRINNKDLKIPPKPITHPERKPEDFIPGKYIERDDGQVFKIMGVEERAFGPVVLIEKNGEQGIGGHSSVTTSIDIGFFDNHHKLL